VRAINQAREHRQDRQLLRRRSLRDAGLQSLKGNAYQRRAANTDQGGLPISVYQSPARGGGGELRLGQRKREDIFNLEENASAKEKPRNPDVEGSRGGGLEMHPKVGKTSNSLQKEKK